MLILAGSEELFQLIVIEGFFAQGGQKTS